MVTCSDIGSCDLVISDLCWSLERLCCVVIGVETRLMKSGSGGQTSIVDHEVPTTENRSFAF